MTTNTSLLSVYLTLCLLFLSSNLSAQTPNEAIRDTSDYPYWIEMMQDPKAGFQETVRAFDLYWKNREVQKGNGWKPFKRWESFMRSRLKADGSKPAPDEVWNEYFLAQKGQKQAKTSSTSNANWTEIGPSYLPSNGTGQPNGVGRLNGIGFHPTDANTIYVGAPQGGVWKTTTGGLSWSSTTDNLPTLGVSSIIVDHSNPNTIYIGTGDRDAGDAPGLGVMKSTDAGDTWISSNTGMGNRTVGMMVMHPTNANTILAATSSGIYKTTNGGSNWTFEQSGNFKDIEYKPTDPNTVYACASGSFYRSTNGGDSWTLLSTSQGIPDAYRMVIAVTPDNPAVVYALASNTSTFKAVYKSTNSGATFTTQSTTPNILDYSTDGSGSSGQAWYDLCLAVDPNDESIVYVGGVNIFKSTNNGQTWTINAHWVGSGGADDIHADQHALEYNPVNDQLYSGNDGGLYFTNNGGTTWTDRSSGLGIAQVYKIGQSATVKDLVINGYQDNGTAIYDGNWRTEIGGDGMECLIDYTDSNYQYGALYYGDMRRSTNNGVNFSSIAGNGVNGINESGSWVTPYALHESDPNTMFIGMRNIWRSTNVKAASSSSVSWTKITNLSTNISIRVVEPSPANTNLLYFVRNGDLYRIDNVMAASPTVIDLDSNLPTTGTPTDVEAHPTNENIVYITLSNNVYKSTNKGASWTDISDNIPNINTNCLVYQVGSDEGLYIGTDAGVYYKDNTLSDWVFFTEELPANSEVTELEIYYDDNSICYSRIRASTYGRGLWESQLQNADEASPSADFRVPSTQICVGGSLLFEDLSICSPDTYQWTFSPNSISYLNGTSSSSPNPEVQFNTATNYSVTLTVTNSIGNNSKTENNYIEVINNISLPYSEDFESVNTCPETWDCGLIVCDLSLSNGWFNETNNSIDAIDWRADSNGTPSSDTGPSIDHTLGTSTGKYLYLEASNGCTGQEAYLTSPCIDIQTGTTELRFWYHAYGSDVGSIHVDALESADWVEDIVTPIAGDQGNTWKEQIVDISSYTGETIKLRIRGITGSGWSSDLAIDDISIEYTPSNNLIANFNATPREGCEGMTVNFMDTSDGSPTNWNWTFAGGTPSSSNAQNPTVTYNTAGVYAATLEVTNANENNSFTQNNYITVFAPPTANITGDLTICDSENTILTASGGTSYIWSTGATSNPITVNPAQNTTYTVTATDDNGCTDTHQVTATVNSSSSISINGNLELCNGESQLLIASGAISYVWSTGATSNRTSINPSENTTYTVTATNAEGCTATQEATVTVHNLPSANISGVLNICSDNTTTLSVPNGANYTWSNDSTNASITISPTTNTTYAVTVSNESGCSAIGEATVTVSNNLAVTINDDKSICSGESTSLSALGGNSYVWSTGSTNTTITINPATTTTYTVTATDASGCTGTDEATITIHSLPTANITGDLEICNGESTTLTASGGTTFDWSTGETSNQISVSPNSNTTYTVEVTDANGCTDTHQVSVVVHANPTANITGDLEICNGESTTLTASGGTTFDWNTSATSNQISVSPNSNTTYTVEVTDANGCTDTHQVNVVIHANPTANITGDLEICNGESTTLTASGGIAFDWSTGATSNQISVSPNSNTAYTVEVTDANGCTDTHQVSVVVHANPTANITGDLEICNGESTTLTASGGIAFDWSTSATSNQISVSPNSNTTYTVEVTDANGCKDTHQVTVSVGTGVNCCVTVVSIEYENTNTLPNCVIADDFIKVGNYGAGNAMISNTQNVQFTAGNYIDLDNGFFVEQGGVFEANVTGGVAVPPSLEVVANAKTAWEQEILSNQDVQLLIAPNPFDETTTFYYQLVKDAQVSLSVFDLAGKQIAILIEEQEQIGGQYKVRFESCNLKSGVYFCVLEMDGERKVSKLLKR